MAVVCVATLAYLLVIVFYVTWPLLIDELGIWSCL